MKVVILPLAYIHGAVCVENCALAMSLAIQPVAFIRKAACRVVLFAIAMCFVFIELAFVYRAVWVFFMFANGFIILPHAVGLNAAIWEVFGALAISHVILPVANVSTIVLVLVSTKAMSHALLPLAIICLVDVWFVQSALAMKVVILPLAYIHGAVCVENGALATFHVILPITIILSVAILVERFALAMSFPIRELAVV